MGLNFFQECQLHYWLDQIFDYINNLFRSPDMYDEIKNSARYANKSKDLEN